VDTASLERGQRAREELWQQSVRSYAARARDEMRAVWCEYHQSQAARHRRTLEALISRHEAEAERQGFSEHGARMEVLAKDHPIGCDCEVCS